MSPWMRIAGHLITGGLILTLIDPPDGIIKYGLIFAIIAGSAYLDRWLLQPRPAKLKGGNVVSLSSYRQSKERNTTSSPSFRERRSFEQIFTSGFHEDIDELLALLRSEGLNPMMVSKSHSNGDSEPVYQIHLPSHEISKARPILKFFQLKTNKKQS